MKAYFFTASVLFLPCVAVYGSAGTSEMEPQKKIRKLPQTTPPYHTLTAPLPHPYGTLTAPLPR